MKKLKNKVFYTIFTILTITLLLIIFIFSFESYQNKRKVVIDNLNRITRDKNIPKDSLQFEDNKIFMDATVYTVILDNDKNIIEIKGHNENNTVPEEIKDKALEIIKDSNSICIGNLYTNRYSYRYNQNIITIIDNEKINNILMSELKVSLIIFIISELVIILISKLLSDWIIKPVIESFNKQKDFIADASHELKTPLAVIIASSEALEKNRNEDKYLDNIKEEAGRMNNLVTRLLNLAKTENNTSIKISENISKITEKSVLTLESLMYEKDIKLETNIEDNINFNCNKDEIKMLLSILLDNAIKHSSSKGLIIVNLKNNKDNIILEVSNKGEALSKEDEEKIFERFYRVDKSRNRNENRYGLGLAIAKNIVTNHTGKIMASSKEGITTFSVIFKKK